MQYILIQTEPKRVVTLTPSDNGFVEVESTVPGDTIYQCISNTGTVGYRTIDGAEYNLIGGSSVLDSNPPVPAWDVPEPDLVPVVEAPAPGPRLLTKLDYMNRFQDDELAAIYGAAKSVIQIEVWLEKFKVSEQIDLDDPRTVGGLQALEQFGLIGAGRANEILA